MRQNLLLSSLLAVILFSCVYNAKAQSKFTYFRFNPSYALPAGKGVITEEVTLRYSNANSRIIEDYTAVNTSMGQGFGASAAIGTIVHPNFGLEVSANYLFGAKKESTEQLVYYSERDVYLNEYRSKCFSIIPAVVLQAEINQSIIYNRTGLVMAFPSMTRESKATGANGDRLEQKFKYTGGMSPGFNTTLGFEIAGSDEVSTFFAEVTFTALNFYPDQREMTAYTYNGVDSLDMVSTSRLITEYSKEHSNWYELKNGTWKEDIDPDQPRQAGLYQVPFGSVSINVGLRFNIYGDKKSAKPIIE